MTYKAKVSFVGRLCMTKGEQKEISDEELVNDLIRAGYIEPIEAEIKKPRGSKSKKNNEEAI